MGLQKNIENQKRETLNNFFFIFYFFFSFNNVLIDAMYVYAINKYEKIYLFLLFRLVHMRYPYDRFLIELLFKANLLQDEMVGILHKFGAKPSRPSK